jgi:hypothetical protein
LSRDAKRRSVVRGRIEFDKHERKLAMLARGQVDLAPQLFLEMAPCEQARGTVAQTLVLQLAAQAFVGALQLFDLVQRLAQLGLLLPLRRTIDPDTGDAAPDILFCAAGQAQHKQLAAHTADFDAMFAGQHPRARQCGLVGRAQCHIGARIAPGAVGRADQRFSVRTQQGAERRIDPLVAATRRIFHRRHRAQALARLRPQHRKQGIMVFGCHGRQVSDRENRHWQGVNTTTGRAESLPGSDLGLRGAADQAGTPERASSSP